MSYSPQKKIYQRRRVRSRKSLIDRCASFVYVAGSSTIQVIKDEYAMFSRTFFSKKNKPTPAPSQKQHISVGTSHKTKKHLDISQHITTQEYIEKDIEIDPIEEQKIIHSPKRNNQDNFLDLKNTNKQIVQDLEKEARFMNETKAPNSHNGTDHQEPVAIIPIGEMARNARRATREAGSSARTQISSWWSYSSRAASLLLAKQGVRSFVLLKNKKKKLQERYPVLFRHYTLFDTNLSRVTIPTVTIPNIQQSRTKTIQPQAIDESESVLDLNKNEAQSNGEIPQKKNRTSWNAGALFTGFVSAISSYWIQLKNRKKTAPSLEVENSHVSQQVKNVHDINTENNDEEPLSTMALLKKKVKKRLPKKARDLIPKKPRGGFWMWIHRLFIIGLISGFVLLGVFFIWVATLEIPDSNIDDLIVAQSTKIYDNTGEVLLYDVFKDERRTVVSLDDISTNMQNAIIATEDDEFYTHGGYDVKAIARSVCHEVVSRLGLGTLGGLCPKGGGSTITQQVIKNTLLNSEHSYKRKVKEVVLASRLEDQKTKDQILEIYLNEIAFGGPVYGVEQASKSFFGISASELSIAQSAFLSALPKAPTTYKNDFAKWEGRAQYIMGRMLSLGQITESQYKEALGEEIEFVERVDEGIKAPHFVFYVQEKLEEQIIQNEEDLNMNGYNIRTTLNWELQQGLEEVVEQHSERLAGHNASNMAIVAVENKTGKIIAMVGSKDYFAEDIDGKFNVANAERQPGSTFKPFVYASALEAGYTPETILWDTQTEFSTSCYPDGTPQLPQYSDRCYMPQNFDKRFRGPISIRSALAQSLNIPAVKALYLVGVRNAMNFAQKMGITTLDRAPSFYGLNLVLGGGEVKLVEMVGAYSVFGNNGIRHRLASWEEITDADGITIDEYEDKKEQAIGGNAARMVNSILSDNNAKRPMFGQNSRLYYESVPVAVKTGTTNNFRDMWTIGYTPEVTIGVWAGNNDNTPMASRPSSSVVGPVWRDAMDEAIALYKPTRFAAYSSPDQSTLKPMLRGDYEGGEIRYVDPETGEEVENPTEEELTAGLYVPQGTVEYHSILHTAGRGTNPQTGGGGQGDGLYENFEYGVQTWVEAQGWQTAYATSTIEGLLDQIQEEQDKQNGGDDTQVTNDKNAPVDFQIVAPISGDVVDGDDRYKIEIVVSGNERDIETIYYYLNNAYLGAGSYKTTTMRMTPNKTRGVQETNTVKVVVETTDGQRIEKTSTLIVQ